MHLILADSFLKKLLTLRSDYESRTKLNLETSPEPYTVSLFFGKKDIKTRLKQISFIENWLIILSSQLKPNLDFTCEEEIQAHLMGLRMLVATAFYIRNQIDDTYTIRSGINATLGLLLEEALLLCSSNLVDEETYACCLLATQRYLRDNQLQTINSILSKRNNNAKNAYISEIEWNKFTIFINQQCNNLDKKWHKDYPITAIMMPLFALPMAAAGTSIGWLVGDLTAKSYSLLPARHAVTALFGSGLILLMGSTSSMGIMLLAPTYAGKLFDTFFGVSFAYVLGSVMRLLGTGVGWGVGMTLDLTWKLLCNACSLLTKAMISQAKLPPITGFNLVNGHRVVNGIELAVMDLIEIEKIKSNNYEAHPITLNMAEDGFLIKIGDEEAKIKWQVSEKDPVYLQELMTKLKASEGFATVESLPEEKQEQMLLPH
ncbi:Dot/Icm secretion system substrate [Legionella beliardensis]|uniref:Dot/Icm secretion system substrate n=1 Tax=Legionella beliardensis TaxID=91822 RepID=A0A378I8D5_9GAMM|nr:hypothetical protein [Legionella beliardensis]STX28644.1 Dot/Icm secretion system substrate [Legionella beliardensis]